MTVAVIFGGLLPVMAGEGLGSDVMKRIAAPLVGGMLRRAPAILDELPLGSGLHYLLQAEAAEDFHRALMKRGRPRVDGRAPVPLDQHVPDAMRRQ